MKIKLGLLATIAIAAIMMTTFHSVAMASPDVHPDQKQMGHEGMHEHMKVRLDKLAERLEIKSSQQAVWEDFAKSVDALADRHATKPADDADAAAISRFHAERATEFAKKLNKVADATAKLQAALTEDQRKVLNQASRRFLHHNHGCDHKDHHGMDHEGHGWHHDDHEEGYHGHSDGDNHQKDNW